MDWSAMIYQGWQGIARTVIVGFLAYVVLVVFLRISGKRTLAKLNAFDFVVTVALGSTLASILLQKSIPLVDGAAALLLLIGLQYLVTFTSVRWKAFAKAVRSEPTLLIHNGAFCEEAMRRERVTHDEATSALRAKGGHHVSDVESLILESDGALSVVLAKRPTATSAPSG